MMCSTVYVGHRPCIIPDEDEDETGGDESDDNIRCHSEAIRPQRELPNHFPCTLS